MNQPEEIERIDAPRRDGGKRGDLHGSAETRAGGREGRVTGSPLPAGSGGQAFRSAPPPGRALTGGTEDNSGAHGAMGVFSQAMPFFQKLLPLIDGNFATALANLLTPRHHPPQGPPVDMTPVKNQVSELQLQQMDLRTQVLEQHASVKRMEDRLEQVREATDRNTLEQQELIEDLKAVGNKVNLFAVLLFGLLIISVLLNLVLFLHISKVFP